MIFDTGWHWGNSGGKTHPMGKKEPNQFGLHDMHGNVYEWCEDVYDPDFYSKPEATRKNPVCTSGSEVVYRDEQVLIEWYDAFDDPLELSQEFSDEDVARFCEECGGSYERIES